MLLAMNSWILLKSGTYFEFGESTVELQSLFVHGKNLIWLKEK